MSGSDSAYTSAGETSPKNQLSKSARPQSLVAPYLNNRSPPRRHVQHSTTSPPDACADALARDRVLAANFADQLDNIFLINDTLDELTNSVENKRFSLTSHNAELEALQARLKRAEELLEAKKKRLSLPGSVPPMPKSPPPPPPAGGSDAAPPMPNAPPPPPPMDESAAVPEAKEGFVVVERSPSVINTGGNVPPMPTRIAPPVPVE
ncbi:hypothetical protein EV426DRAFT_397010 [Tirmania nivea]|nr:hypothetical protein EV426DRAFT_397010 [Tirmania nivea]